MTKQANEEVTLAENLSENENRPSSSNKWEELAQQTKHNTEAEEPLIEQPPYDELMNHLTQKEAEAEQYKQEMLREKAESENYRKRLEVEFNKRQKVALESFVNSLLPIVDSLERSLEVQGCDDNDFKATREGVELALKMFMDVLVKHAVQAVDPQGQMFNPQLHEAMSAEASNEVEPNTVMQVLQKGYLLHDRLIRPALVIVAAKG